jgi:hypothetical protein
LQLFRKEELLKVSEPSSRSIACYEIGCHG